MAASFFGIGDRLAGWAVTIGSYTGWLRGVVLTSSAGAEVGTAGAPLVTTSTAPPIGGAYTDRSIANLSGASEQLMAANASRRILIISNEGATAVAVNLTGGTAALNTAGSVTLSPGGSINEDVRAPVGAITIIGTLNADVTAYEG